MSDPQPPELTPAERVEDIPRILGALRQAVRGSAPTPQARGQSGRGVEERAVEWIQPEDIPDQPEPPGDG